MSPPSHIIYIIYFIGSSGPPPSRHLLVYEVPPYQMIIIGVLTGIGLVITVAFLIFNIVWRKNK